MRARRKRFSKAHSRMFLPPWIDAVAMPTQRLAVWLMVRMGEGSNMRTGRWRLTAARCTVGSRWWMSSPEVREFPWRYRSAWCDQLWGRDAA